MADVGLRMRPDAGPRTGGARAPARRGSARLVAGLGAGWRSALALRLRGALGAVFGAVMIASFATYRAADPSFNVASGEAPRNAMGGFGAIVADMGLQTFGLTAWVGALMMIIWGFNRAGAADPRLNRGELRVRAAAGALGMLLLAGVLAMPQPPADWPLARGLGGCSAMRCWRGWPTSSPWRGSRTSAGSPRACWRSAPRRPWPSAPAFGRRM